MTRSPVEAGSAPTDRSSPPVIGPLVLGGAITLLVAICTILAWPAGSMVAAQPAAVPTDDTTWIRIFGWAQILALAVFVAALPLVRRRPPPARLVLIIAAAIQLLPLAAPLIFSTDAYSYWNTGRIAAVHGANPYLEVPASFPGDPSSIYIPGEWLHRPSVYGPVFTGLAEGVAYLSGEDAWIAAWLFKAVAAASMLVLIVLISRMAPRPAFAAAFVGWNPVLAIQFAGAGHNDALMITLFIVGVWYAHRRQVRLAGALVATSVLVKSLIFVVVPLQVLEDRAKGRPSLVPSLTWSALVIAILATVSFGLVWLTSFGPLIEHAAVEGPSGLAIWPRLFPQAPGLIVKFGPLIGFAILYVVLLREAWRGRARRGLAIGALLVASPILWTWYVIAPAALAALEDDRPAMLVALGLCAYTSAYLGVSGDVLQVLLR